MKVARLPRETDGDSVIWTTASRYDTGIPDQVYCCTLQAAELRGVVPLEDEQLPPAVCEVSICTALYSLHCVVSA